ncbi:Phosphoglucosamine mutase [Acaryochloris thomasi RCC1774]|uniref:Phosphoglucosamine mutase n=1 Tax=Acaryochloris thomasi RCC1774 TaxID=1764569 RepID=A0A2W1JLP8_9CYAN|nr:phosphoglucomutase/phosphomannomutase family protein [Acaryochloris thomasi]PZD74136.1 Phosphoglucosamine mutase [Acaryochloris thomasi RCC1774]
MPVLSSNHLTQKPIKFGTDGWRGVIAADFTFERLKKVAPVAAQVLSATYGESTGSRLVIVGYDRRFLSEEFAQVTADAVAQAGFDVLLSNDYAPTPAFSWAAYHRQALGALVITASHNPGQYSGLKVKGAFGGSVPLPVTQKIQSQLEAGSLPSAPATGQVTSFNPWPEYCQVLKSKVDLSLINTAINEGKLSVYVDPMHGATAGGLGQLLEAPIKELNSERDPLFGGGAPEPLPKYLPELIQALKSRQDQGVALGLVFDGDGDRIAAIDGQGEFLSSQFLIPILIDHLATHRGMTGEVIKTISGSDLFPRVAALHDLPIYETSIGYKYIADRMLETQETVLIGGEESGGIGYGNHIPERDGLLSALYLLEALAQTGKDLSELYQQLQARTDYHCAYDRIDVPLASDSVKVNLQGQLSSAPFQEILGQSVIDVGTGDGSKFRLADQSWLLVRFSGTEPVLRLYCEAANPARVDEILNWAKQWATQVDG